MSVVAPPGAAVFLDRDGTLNVERHYLSRAEEFQLLPGVEAALADLQSPADWSQACRRLEDELLHLALALAAVLDRPADAEPAVLGHLLHDLAVHGATAVLDHEGVADLVGEQLVVVGRQLGAERLLLGRVGDVHGAKL